MFAKLTRKLPLLIPVLAFALVWVSPAYAAEADCTSNGGVWSGIDSDNGTCTYPAENSVAVAACGSDEAIYKVTFEFDSETDANCIFPPGNIRTNTRIYSPEDTQTGFVLRLKGDHNGYVEFFDNSCINSCTIDYVLPDLAMENIALTPRATLYVRVDGGAGSGSYRACFENPYGEGLNLDQFIGGNWVLVNFSHTNPICALATGDGAFYLH